jgi:ADP-ribose pyrophosphatase YjhB (NUDIX family)
MNREFILQQLRLHRPADERECAMTRRIEAFVTEHERWFDRRLSIGHVTASAWVVDRSGAEALLTHHRKLNLWVQLGGHIEDDADLLRAAWREAREESGVQAVAPVSDQIFDVDVHDIPERPGEPAHVHYDIRFLFTADRQAPLIVSRESKTLAWMPLDRIPELTQEESILRMIRKTSHRPALRADSRLA